MKSQNGELEAIRSFVRKRQTVWLGFPKFRQPLVHLVQSSSRASMLIPEIEIAGARRILRGGAQSAISGCALALDSWPGQLTERISGIRQRQRRYSFASFWHRYGDQDSQTLSFRTFLCASY